MEAPAVYGSSPVRPRLTVVKDGPATYSALPHAVLFSDLPDGAVRLYAVLQSYWWKNGECSASHATLASDLRVGERQLRRLLDKLIAGGHIVERPAGTRRSKTYAPSSISQKCPIEAVVNETPESDSGPSNRTSMSRQSDIFGQGNQSKMSDSKKKTPEKKTKKKQGGTNVPPARLPTAQSRVIDLIVAGGAPSPTFGGRAGKAVREAGDPETVAAAYLAVWRGEWGDPWLRENLSIHAVVDRLDGFRVWQSDQAPAVPHANGTASKVTPATDEDRAIWCRALDDLRDNMNAANFETYLASLEVIGRNEDGGLCLLVAPGTTDGVSRMRNHIHRALMDAGDPAPMAVAFKARRPKEPTHAE